MDTSVKTLTMLSIDPGTVIAGRYEVHEKVGSGGMGMVFRVHDRHLNDEHVALKLLHPHLAEDEDVFQRFRNEVLVARSLSHPNIIRLHDIGRAEQGFFYISMEYVDGYSLKDRMVGGAKVGLPDWNFDEALITFYQICCAVSYAHSKGIIHRDLKPANVMVSKSNDIKLGDFGTARIVGLSRNFTQTGQVIGTPDYMAPEQIQGHPLDAKCDIYALGIIGYELATGEKPFNADSAVALAFKHISEPLPRFASEEKGIPEWYEAIIRRAAEKDKENRFASVADMVRAMLEHRPDLSTSGTLFVNEPKRAKAGGGASGGADATLGTSAKVAVTSKSTRVEAGGFELGEIKTATDDKRSGWSVGGDVAPASVAEAATKGKGRFLALAGVLLIIAGVVGVTATNPKLIRRLRLLVGTEQVEEIREVAKEAIPEVVGTATSASAAATVVAAGDANSSSPEGEAQRLREELGNEVFEPAAEPPVNVAAVTPPVVVASVAVEPAGVGTAVIEPESKPEALPIEAAPIEEAPPEPLVPVAPEQISVAAVQLRDSAQGKSTRSIDLARLGSIDWRATVSGVVAADDKALRERIKKEFKAQIFKQKANQKGGEVVTTSSAQFISRASDGAVQIGGKLSAVAAGKLSTGEFRLEVLRDDEIMGAQPFDVYRTAAEPAATGAVAVVTNTTLTNQLPPTPTAGGLPVAVGPTPEVAPPAPPAPAPEVAPTGAATESFKGMVTSGSGQKLLTLNITIADNKISGQASIDGLGDFQVSGDMFPRGFEMALRNSQIGIRLSGSRTGTTLRGRYYNSTSQERGTWEAHQ